MNPSNTYIPKYVPDNLKWYERDGLLTWYKQCKCKDFLGNTDGHFEETEIVNFDIIHRWYREEDIPKRIPNCWSWRCHQVSGEWPTKNIFLCI